MSESHPSPVLHVASALLAAGAVALLATAAHGLRHPAPPALAPAPAPATGTASPSASPRPDLPSALPQPIPITSSIARPGIAPSLAAALLQQARDLRYQGFPADALTKLQEARLIEPRNPLVLAETGVTYEQLRKPEDAQAIWRDLHALGETAGALRDLASYKLAGSSSPPSAPLPSPASPASDAPSGEIPPGSLLGIESVTREENRSADNSPFTTFRITIKARPDSPIETSDVDVVVYFYQMVNGQYIVQQSEPDADYHWVSLPADWAPDSGGREILEIDYHPPPADDQPLQNRQFFGYSVRVYHKSDLQDVSADPLRLLNQFPAPSTYTRDTP